MADDSNKTPVAPAQSNNKQQQRQPQQPQFEVSEGDNICMSCTGVLFYSKEMREKQQKPVCVGANTMLKYRVSEDTMKRVDEKQAKRRAEDVFICMGYSRWSGRMERKGQTPSCLDGIAIARHPDPPKETKPTEEKQGLPAPVHLPPPIQLPSMQVIDEFAGKVTRSAVQNVDIVGKFWQRSLTDFPDKFERSATRMANSMATTPSRVGRAFTKVCGLLFGDDEDT